MTCVEAEPLLHAYLDGELDLRGSLDVERHLADCRACAAQYAMLTHLREEIADAGLRYDPDREFERRLRTTVPPGPAAWWRSAWMAAAAGAIAALVFLVVPLRPRTGGDERTLLDSHLRSLLPDHLVDVPSSDQHTVKPWFQGKTSFSPPVPDLEEKGFHLVGGRLEILDRQPAAVLVYKSREHVISLYVVRSAGPRERRSETELEGYRVLHWTANGLSYSAVSDLNLSELRTFADQYGGS